MNEARDAMIGRFDERAATYDDNAMHRALADAVAAFASLDGVGTVLDVATGTGLFLRALGSARPLRMVGIDLSPGMLAVARAALPEAELVVGDAAALPFAAGSVDLVTCVTALHLVPDADAAFREWVRVLRPGGRVVTATFGPPTDAAPTDAAAHGGDEPRPYPTFSDRFHTPEALARAVAPAGLVVRRHAWWTHGGDTLLLAELSPTGSAEPAPA